MFKIPEQIIKIADKYKLSLPKSPADKNADIWCVGKNFILKHDALTRIAKVEGIIFHQPQITEIKSDNKYYGFMMIGEAELDGIKIWTTADSTKENTMAKYYINMCEKRLRDRLTLKLLDLYEYGLYSDVEAEDFKKPVEDKPMTKYQATQIVNILKHQVGYDKDVVKAIMRDLTHAEAIDVLDHFHSGRIEEAIETFYKLYKGEK